MNWEELKKGKHDQNILHEKIFSVKTLKYICLVFCHVTTPSLFLCLLNFLSSNSTTSSFSFSPFKIHCTGVCKLKSDLSLQQQNGPLPKMNELKSHPCLSSALFVLADGANSFSVLFKTIMCRYACLYIGISRVFI